MDFDFDQFNLDVFRMDRIDYDDERIAEFMDEMQRTHGPRTFNRFADLLAPSGDMRRVSQNFKNLMSVLAQPDREEVLDENYPEVKVFETGIPDDYGRPVRIVATVRDQNMSMPRLATQTSEQMMLELAKQAPVEGMKSSDQPPPLDDKKMVEVEGKTAISIDQQKVSGLIDQLLQLPSGAKVLESLVSAGADKGNDNVVETLALLLQNKIREALERSGPRREKLVIPTHVANEEGVDIKLMASVSRTNAVKLWVDNAAKRERKQIHALHEQERELDRLIGKIPLPRKAKRAGVEQKVKERGLPLRSALASSRSTTTNRRVTFEVHDGGADVVMASVSDAGTAEVAQSQATAMTAPQEPGQVSLAAGDDHEPGIEMTLPSIGRVVQDSRAMVAPTTVPGINKRPLEDSSSDDEPLLDVLKRRRLSHDRSSLGSADSSPRSATRLTGSPILSGDRRNAAAGKSMASSLIKAQRASSKNEKALAVPASTVASSTIGHSPEETRGASLMRSRSLKRKRPDDDLVSEEAPLTLGDQRNTASGNIPRVQSKTPGVHREEKQVRGKSQEYYVANWTDATGNRRHYISISKYGEIRAKQLAIEHIEKIVSSGAGVVRNSSTKLTRKETREMLPSYPRPMAIAPQGISENAAASELPGSGSRADVNIPDSYTHILPNAKASRLIACLPEKTTRALFLAMTNIQSEKALQDFEDCDAQNKKTLIDNWGKRNKANDTPRETTVKIQAGKLMQFDNYLESKGIQLSLLFMNFEKIADTMHRFKKSNTNKEAQLNQTPISRLCELCFNDLPVKRALDEHVRQGEGTTIVSLDALLAHEGISPREFLGTSVKRMIEIKNLLTVNHEKNSRLRHALTLLRLNYYPQEADILLIDVIPEEVPGESDWESDRRARWLHLASAISEYPVAHDLPIEDFVARTIHDKDTQDRVVAWAKITKKQLSQFVRDLRKKQEAMSEHTAKKRRQS